MAATYYTVPTVTATTTESLSLFVGWGKLKPDVRSACLALLISRLHGNGLGGIRLVEAVLACFTCALPEMGPHLATMGSVETTVVDVPSSSAEALIGGSNPMIPALANLVKVGPTISDAIIVTDTDGLYAAVASILMALGKQAGAGPDAAVLKSRPDALINRFGISEAAQGCLPGREFGPTQAVMGAIFNVFSTYTEARMLITQYFLGVSKNVGHPPKYIEILMTNFRLLRGTQLAHMVAITRLMNMHPWTVRVPELTPYYREFARELKEFEKIPADVRQYHRMLVPQSEFMFVSSTYQPLIAVAGDFVKDVEATFGNYVYRATDFAQLIGKVREYEPGRAQFVGAGTLAQELGIQDMALPPVRAANTIIPRPIQ